MIITCVQVGLVALGILVQDWNRIQLQHPWRRSNIRYKTLELPNEIRCLESTDSTPNKKLHLKLINPTCLSPL